MSKTDSAATTASNITFPFGSPEALGDTFTDTLSRNRAAVESAMQTLNAEALRFIGKRLEHTGQAIEEYQDCHTLPEFISVQQKWAADAVREYVDESFRLHDTMQKVLGGFASAAKKERPPKAPARS